MFGGVFKVKYRYRAEDGEVLYQDQEEVIVANDAEHAIAIAHLDLIGQPVEFSGYRRPIADLVIMSVGLITELDLYEGVGGRHGKLAAKR